MQKIPFNRPYLSGREHDEMNSALATGKHCGNGPKSKEAESWLQRHYGLGRAFLVPSGTAALEMAAVVADVKAGDEFILPSYTFSSTANAFCIRGAKPIFAEVDPDTLVMDVRDVANKISKKTKAIVPINY
ncbi:MAG TPA: aminotransferase class I/II-fold pyridoxal phosphate-dependent enzyme, partial [Saprospiraceae bacterium]|nr:aminotransferase class I/II-fold pyridoxal phosphate-dependent enzyme [Saprospiraceae bacterium]